MPCASCPERRSRRERSPRSGIFSTPYPAASRAPRRARAATRRSKSPRAEGSHCFLSRARRFGESPFLDTLKELFEGSEALFEGLHIHEPRDWSVRHPVVRLSFGAGHFKEPGYLHVNLMSQLDYVEEQAGAERIRRRGSGKGMVLLVASGTAVKLKVS